MALFIAVSPDSYSIPAVCTAPDWTEKAHWSSIRWNMELSNRVPPLQKDTARNAVSVCVLDKWPNVILTYVLYCLSSHESVVSGYDKCVFALWVRAFVRVSTCVIPPVYCTGVCVHMWPDVWVCKLATKLIRGWMFPVAALFRWSWALQTLQGADASLPVWASVRRVGVNHTLLISLSLPLDGHTNTHKLTSWCARAKSICGHPGLSFSTQHLLADGEPGSCDSVSDSLRPVQVSLRRSTDTTLV